MHSIAPQHTPRLTLDNRLPDGLPATIATDVHRGLTSLRKSLPPKYFYDDAGSRLFDLICEQPEYYPTRTERALLEHIADDLMDTLRPTDLIELGSGVSRKTCALLDAAERARLPLRYVPVDVSGQTLRRAAESLLSRYPWLHVHGLVGDYEQHLRFLPAGSRRLVAFLGGTIGNFLDAEARRFLSNISRQLEPGDHLLLGVDLVKDTATLNAAYNDAAGVTAAFNRNILRVINRALDGDFDPGAFEHVAYFNDAESQIEMHLRSIRDQKVRLNAINLTVRLDRGETIQTEVSRKFSRSSISQLLEASGFRVRTFFVPPDNAFALALAQVTASTG